MSLQCCLLQQLLFHFQQCYQCLLSYVKYDTGRQEINLVIDNFDCMSGWSRSASEYGIKKDIYISHLKLHDKNITTQD